MQEVQRLLAKGTLEGVKDALEAKTYKMLAKLKKNNKQINESVIDRDAFTEVLKAVDGQGLSEAAMAIVTPLLQVNPNHSHIFQAKVASFLLDEVHTRRELLRSANVEQTKEGAQVVSFKQLESDEEN